MTAYRVGYAGVSTSEETPANQLDGLHAAARQTVFVDQAGGCTIERDLALEWTRAAGPRPGPAAGSGPAPDDDPAEARRRPPPLTGPLTAPAAGAFALIALPLGPAAWAPAQTLADERAADGYAAAVVG